MHDYDAQTWQCQECDAPYKLLDDKTCAVKCEDLPKPPAVPGIPKNAVDLNGVEWPAACFDQEDEVTFFAIGDWGGMCGGPNFDPNDPHRNVCTDPPKDTWRPQHVLPGKPFAVTAFQRDNYIDSNAQTLVADKMLHQYKNLSDLGMPPRFVINVGDSFYPGGIEEHCSNMDGSQLSEIMMKYQFKAVFEDMYWSDDMPEFNKLEWWTVLGNHDYGGNCYIKAWDQIIFYTWKPNGRWILPAPYWKRHVQFKRFDAEFFFIDTNILDVEPGNGNPKQNICFHDGNTDTTHKENHCHFTTASLPTEGPNQLPYFPNGFAGDSCPKTGPMNADDCVGWFKNLWEQNRQWLEKEVGASKADWKIVVHHYPVKYLLPGLNWVDFSKKYGIDLIITGHQHEMSIYWNEVIPDDPEKKNLGPTAHVITGGGGGFQTSLAPKNDGEDDTYGYVVVKLASADLELFKYSHGAKLMKDGGKQILRKHIKAPYITPELEKSTAQDKIVV